ncbi:MAG: hypothetical protein MR332_10505, partial [Fusicatenibacter sp.]|nr:hypothetical protein [Fusicatenibacter sp.]
KHNSFTGGYGGLLLDISILPQISEELFYFVTKNIPYLCGFWRFANAYFESCLKGFFHLQIQPTPWNG